MKPGDFGLTSLPGIVGQGIRAGQALIGDWSVYTHAFIFLGDDYILEAMPGGARIATIDEYKDSKYLTFSRFDLTGRQREEIVYQALRLEGTPYSFADYLSLAATHYKIRPKSIRDFVQDSGHMICSQLVTEVYLRSGLQIFPGTDSLDVTPGDLANRLISGAPLLRI